MTILITGAAGFIGFHTCKKLLEEGKNIIGIDNINNYYSTDLKESRLKILKSFNKNQNDNFKFFVNGIDNNKKVYEIFDTFRPSEVINLAAQAGVRYSIENPNAYIQSNLVGFANILEACRKFSVKHLLLHSFFSPIR